ncbi:MAG: HugZ family protein [Rhodospirillales bacterium]
MTDAAAARRLIRRARTAALATTLPDDRGGRAYASLVTVACDGDGRPLLLLSTLAEHTRNLAADARAALLFEAASGRASPQTGPRVTVLGRIERSAAPERHLRRFLARHPGAARYAGFADFGCYRMAVERAHFVGGFARAQWLAGDELVLAGAAAAAIAAAEPDILAHMNADHGDAIGLYANRLLGRRGTGWTMVAVDPEGCDLRRGSVLARLDFPRPATDIHAVRDTLTTLADEARRRGG